MSATMTESFATMSPSRETPIFSQMRAGAFERAPRLRSPAGITARAEYEVVAEYSPEAGQAALGPLLALAEPPTAVLVGSDTQAQGVLEAARRLGYQVPTDLSVVGYNDIEVAPYLGLTTVHVPMYEMGQRGGELLLALLGRPAQPPEPIRLPAELIVRTTTGPRPE